MSIQCPNIFVVVPAYNEGQVLARTVAELVDYPYQIVIVDDGSETPASSWLWGTRVHCLRHVTNLGQGAALRTGTEYALAAGADVIVHFDADGQHKPALIARLIEPILSGACDVVLGSRFLQRSDRDMVPVSKQILLKCGVVVSWIFTGLWLTDTHNGFRALSAAAARQMKITENGFAHATEILELIRRSSLRYCEVPVTIRYSDYSMAKGQSVLNSINILIDLTLRKIFQ
jgi:glycosyltransferase involved in cell wall biosynthesis